MIRYVHKSDDSPCDPPRVTGTSPLCIKHGRQVRMVVERTPDPLPEGDNTISVQDVAQDIARRAAGGVPEWARQWAAHDEVTVAAIEEHDARRAAKDEHWAHWLFKSPVTHVSLKDDEVDRADKALSRLSVGDTVHLVQVGWYCAGGHTAAHQPPDFLVPPSLRMDDPCEHGVPVFIVERDHSVPSTPPTEILNTQRLSRCEGCGMALSACSDMMRTKQLSCCNECEHHS